MASAQASSLIHVELLQSMDAVEWERFLDCQRAATFYHTLRYRDLLLDVAGGRDEYLVAKRSGEIAGVLPLMTKQGALGTVINSLPFFGSHGGVVTEDPLAASALWDAYQTRCAAPDVAAATIIGNPFAEESGIPAHHDIEDHRISQVTVLDSTSVFDRFDGSTRRNIQKAKRSGVNITVENDAFEFLARTHVENMNAIGGTAKPPRFFDAVPRIFRPGRDYRIYVARVDGREVAALLLFYYKQFVEYFTPVTVGPAREHQPMAAILHRAMRDALEEGYRIWNWGGTWTTQTGVYRFKRKWGAEERNYVYYTSVANHCILARRPEEILAAYPYYFTAPFSHLVNRHDPI